ESEKAARLWSFADYRFGPGEPGVDWAEWTERAEQEVTSSRRPPFADGVELPGGEGVTRAAVLRIDRVVEARSRDDTQPAKLARLLNVTSALGLAVSSKERPAVLAVPRSIALDQTKARVAELKAHSPDFERSFTSKGLPDVIVPKVRQVARSSYQALLGPGR